MNKSKNILIISVIFVVVLSCIYTNPTKSEYINWATESLQSESTTVLERGLVGFLGNKIIRNTTTSNNYILFSIYKTEIGDVKLITLGILKNFICINGNDIKDKIKSVGAN